jgi:hypothetical protein
MQAIERVAIMNNWITIVFVFALILVVLLKSLDAQKLKGYVFAVFNKGFVEVEAKEGTSFFTLFQNLLFLFTSTIVSLIVYFLLTIFSQQTATNYITFGVVFFSVFGYFLLRWFLEFLIGVLFLIRNVTKPFLFSKFSYLHSISFGFFILLILYHYTFSNPRFLVIGTVLIILIRLFFLLNNNKNLIISKLFYFILYLCAFELAPLFILYKLIF